MTAPYTRFPLPWVSELPWTTAGTFAAMAGVALAASYLPARRATRIDPVATLKAE